MILLMIISREVLVLCQVRAKWSKERRGSILSNLSIEMLCLENKVRLYWPQEIFAL